MTKPPTTKSDLTDEQLAKELEEIAIMLRAGNWPDSADQVAEAAHRLLWRNA